MKKILMQGNEAVAEAAVKAGIKFYAAYPITPASEIMHVMAKKKDIKFVHAEDEIAAVMMAIGASISDGKSMTSTSGPGFSLMQESIGMATMTETPLVIVNVQRVGPSTGMPTLPSQGDVLQSAYGSHGDRYPIVFYPNSVSEMYKYTIESFNAAEENQGPVILLSDGFLGHLYETVELDKIDYKVKDRKGKKFGTGNRHYTGLISKNGIPMTKDTKVYREWIKKVKERTEKIAKNYAFYEYLENEKSNTLLIAYGITSRVILPLKEKYSIFRPIRMFPVLEKELKKISEKYKKIIVIEMNDGQYKKEIERVLKREIESIPILGGSIHLSEIKDKLK
ncbi:MAG: 2-oxoacid:acceptor oxidoreductase subunit alpha [Nanoarchaeota archaeon]|nr:2-oxoacid:acceptor oxidoreductase subunit alpha [Nanoarchaeota archaeon]MCG2718111.1 2-oxoacid:acceptor oxidoreductase subunit alpha [Nanoarchaeota archaeon]